MITTKEVKNNLLYYFLYSRDFLCATTEMKVFDGLSLGDIVGLNKTLKFYEVEVKINPIDLTNELKTIDCIMNNKPLNIKLSKYLKHLTYIKNPTQEKLFIPHKFYFSISPEYKEKTLQILNKTSYGLMDFDGNIYKSAKYLHNKKINKDFIYNMLQRLSRVNYNLSNTYEKQTQ